MQAAFLPQVLGRIEARWQNELLPVLTAQPSYPPLRPFRAIFDRQPAILAEIKLASPSAGVLGQRKEAVARARQYETAGAAAISVVTEPEFFHGDLELIAEIKQEVSLPVLVKDFILYPGQVYEARQAGADGLLLIVRLLDEARLTSLVRLCRQLGIEPVLEIFDHRDWQLARRFDDAIVLINNRDLMTLELDIKRSLELLPLCLGRKVISASGITSAKTARQLLEKGASGLLIGTSLMRSPRPGEVLAEILQNRRE